MRNHYINVVASCLCFPRLTMRSLARSSSARCCVPEQVVSQCIMRGNNTGRRHTASVEVKIVSEVHLRTNDFGRRHAT